MQSFEQQLERTRADEKAREFADMMEKLFSDNATPPITGGLRAWCNVCGAPSIPRDPCTMPSCPHRPLGGS